MGLMHWLHEHLVAPLMPDISVDTNDRLYDWVEHEHEALRRQIETERDIILRRAREQETNGEHQEGANGLA